MRLWNERYVRKQICAAGVLLCAALLCSACAKPADSRQDTGSVTNAAGSMADTPQYTTRDGKTGVVLKSGMLRDCFTLTVEETADAGQDVTGVEPMADCVISAGDVVLILDEQPAEHEGMTRVMLPYGDAPNTYGYLASESLSTAPTDIKNGNQARITDCRCYNKPDGNVVETMSGCVQILSRDTGWCEVEQLGTGADAVWVRTDALSFDFDQSVLDIAP